MVGSVGSHVNLQYFKLVHHLYLLIPTVADVQRVVFRMQAARILTKDLAAPYSSAKDKVISLGFKHDEAGLQSRNSKITQARALH